MSGAYVVDANGCHIWQGVIAPNGYGKLGEIYAHRMAFEQAKGPIPDGLHIDHLCRVRACVNPAHLEAVTQAENNRRAADARTTCKNNHPRTPENTVDDGGFRRCLTCRREKAKASGKRYRAAHPEKRREIQRVYRARVRKARADA